MNCLNFFVPLFQATVAHNNTQIYQKIQYKTIIGRRHKINKLIDIQGGIL